MTREEAKKIFGELLLFGKAPCKKEELEDLCKVVLTALEQEPTTKNDLGVDCISRAEAIKCLECDFDITGKENMKTVVNYINSAHDKIVNLPRVKQEPVIDKIRADIQNGIHHFLDGEPIIEIKEVLQIIDKYKAESEGIRE